MLFTFPSRYCALSVICSYLALEGGPPVFRQDFTCPALLFAACSLEVRYRPVTCSGAAFHPLRSPSRMQYAAGLLPFRSPLLWESRLISFPPGTEMFQFPGFAPSGLCIRPVGTLARGFPHSESLQSKALCASCRTIAAWRVLRRRQMPRHPPRAFFRIIFFSSGSALVLLHEQLESTLLLVLQVTLA